jgi:hypothetical protein
MGRGKGSQQPCMCSFRLYACLVATKCTLKSKLGVVTSYLCSITSNCPSAKLAAPCALSVAKPRAMQPSVRAAAEVMG